MGNHDTDSGERQDILRMLIMLYKINKVGSLYKYKNKFWLSHAPIHPQELRGLKNVHGHCHNNSIDDNRYINVSCEAVNYTPIQFKDIK